MSMYCWILDSLVDHDLKSVTSYAGTFDWKGVASVDSTATEPSSQKSVTKQKESTQQLLAKHKRAAIEKVAGLKDGRQLFLPRVNFACTV